jgi:hypothetical protein
VAVTLLLAILTVAAITHVWMNGSIFGHVRARLDLWKQRREWWFRVPATGARCHYCFSVWVAIGLGIGLWLVPDATHLVMVAASAILPANALLVLFVALTERLPMLIDATVARTRAEAKRAEVELARSTTRAA